MNINLLSFSECLSKVKAGKMPYMIRMRWLSADYINRVVLLYNTNHLRLHFSCQAGLPKTLQYYKCAYDKAQTSEIANVPSDDLLADDWLDLNGWAIAKTKDSYNSFMLDGNEQLLTKISYSE